MDWLFFALVCAWSIATSDALVKKRLQGYTAGELLLVRFTLSGLLFSPFLIYLPLDEATASFWWWMAIAVPAEIIAMLLYMKAVRDHPLSETLPYLSFTPVFAILTGWIALGEQVSLSGFSGILLITSGAWLLNLHTIERLSLRTIFHPLVAIFRNHGSLMMLAAAMIYSFTLAASKAALLELPTDDGSWIATTAFGAFYFVMVGLVGLVVVTMTQPKAVTALWRRPRYNLLVASLMAVMVVTHFIAVQQVEAAYMIAVKRTSLLFGIIYGAWWFREQGLARNLPAGILMVIGVAVIVLA